MLSFLTIETAQVARKKFELSAWASRGSTI